ncbi:hypothetical protein [Marinimicrobium sp. ABcell2]|uniref:hypothetical protein n=1 Tax=Marinimicrobium sp. ABcell2 TaxID=3069751 RepID=UPI0027AE6788|nr:hypothetical protein [Marinimicrobium sp. ABcell2]MDQ2076922.1 hypothetical protein [Marinimicrobium sp. ABcell2]
MNVEIIGDREFIRSVRESDGAWVLYSEKAVYFLKVEGGIALPIWTSRQNAKDFSIGLERRGLSPVFVPLDYLLGNAWLGSQTLNILEVLASPRHGQQALTYTAGELSEKLKT